MAESFDLGLMVDGSTLSPYRLDLAVSADDLFFNLFNATVNAGTMNLVLNAGLGEVPVRSLSSGERSANSQSIGSATLDLNGLNGFLLADANGLTAHDRWYAFHRLDRCDF